MRKNSRRRFLYVLAGGGAGLVAGVPWWSDRSQLPPATTPATGPNGTQLDRRQHVSRTAWALGSAVTIRALHVDRQVAAAGIDAAFTELATVEAVMSIYRPDSQLSRLNRDGKLDKPHPYLLDVLRAASEMSGRTEGAFDVTVQPLWQAYWTAHEKGRSPTEQELAAARGRINWRHVEVTDRYVRLRRPQAAITLNGIAQGFAADCAKRALRRRGVDHALIDTGEFGSLGHGADRNGWNVGIQHPRQEDHLVAVASLAGRCLATSGDYATRFDSKFASHHLLDPRTGRSASELSSVSIIGDTGMAADALSTAAFVLGLERGAALVSATPGAEALFVTKTGRRWTSPGFPLREAV